MSPEWYLSFGFGEFDKDMKEQEVTEGCEEARLQLLNLRSQTTKVHCPNVGKFFSNLSFNFLLCPCHTQLFRIICNLLRIGSGTRFGLNATSM
jgi:hypothetical protein